MTGYNRLNGRWCSEDRELLTDILRGEWGFEGFVLTDWYGVASTVGSNAAGVDLEMPGPGRAYGAALADAVRDGSVAAEDLDDQVGRLLAVYERLGILDETDEAPPPPRPAAGRARHRGPPGGGRLHGPAQERRPPPSVATGGFDGGGRAQRRRRRHDGWRLGRRRTRSANEPAGSAAGETGRRRRHCCPRAGSRPVPGDGCPAHPVDSGVLRRPRGRRRTVHRAELHATELMHLGPPVAAMDGAFSVRAAGVYRPSESGRYLFTLTHVGRARLIVDGVVVLDGFDGVAPPGDELHGSRFSGADRGSGTHRWSGRSDRRSSTTRPAPTASSPSGSGCRWLAPADLRERAVAAAGTADMAIVVVGTSNEWESEGFDRESLALPVDQDDLVRRVAAANPRTVVVVNTGAPVAMPWADDVGAVLQIWFGGQEMAAALAEVLTGDEEPGGRLPVSLPRRLEDTPAYPTFPGERSEQRYGEGLLVGYRWYETRDIGVTFPFGHGLSYTTFRLGEPHLSSSTVTAGDDLVVTVPVTNTGDRAGSEVVQCYVAPPPGELFRPTKELKAFGKIRLDPGETGPVSLRPGRTLVRPLGSGYRPRPPLCGPGCRSAA